MSEPKKVKEIKKEVKVKVIEKDSELEEEVTDFKHDRFDGTDSPSLEPKVTVLSSNEAEQTVSRSGFQAESPRKESTAHDINPYSEGGGSSGAQQQRNYAAQTQSRRSVDSHMSSSMLSGGIRPQQAPTTRSRALTASDVQSPLNKKDDRYAAGPEQEKKKTRRRYPWEV